MKEFPVIQHAGNMNIYEQLSHRIDQLEEVVKQLSEQVNNLGWEIKHK